jgi:hypothetical protein
VLWPQKNNSIGYPALCGSDFGFTDGEDKDAITHRDLIIERLRNRPPPGPSFTCAGIWFAVPRCHLPDNEAGGCAAYLIRLSVLKRCYSIKPNGLRQTANLAERGKTAVLLNAEDTDRSRR